MKVTCRHCGNEFECSDSALMAYCPVPSCGGDNIASPFVIECLWHLERGNGITGRALFRDLSTEEKAVLQKEVASKLRMYESIQKAIQ